MTLILQYSIMYTSTELLEVEALYRVSHANSNLQQITSMHANLSSHPIFELRFEMLLTRYPPIEARN